MNTKNSLATTNSFPFPGTDQTSLGSAEFAQAGSKFNKNSMQQAGESSLITLSASRQIPCRVSIPTNPISDIGAISFFNHPITTTTPSMSCSIIEVHDMIVGDKYRDLITEIRGDREHASQLKRTKLDFVTFSGLFPIRKQSGLKEHSGLIVFDFDDLADVNAAK